jgi:hypothetical protein
MNKTVGIILVVLVIIGGIFLITRAGAPSNTNTNGESNVKGSGRIVFAVTDAAANMGQISEVNMRVSRVDIHSQESGWITASTSPKTYELLALNAKSESQLLADVNEKSGTYDQVRLTIDDVNVKLKSGTMHQATMPKNELALTTSLVVKDGTTSTATFDFKADKSLFTTTSGAYVFAPVVETETRSDAGVSVDTDSTVTIGGGKVEHNSTSGMDVDGSVKLNFELNSLQKLNIEGNSILKLDTELK